MAIITLNKDMHRDLKVATHPSASYGDDVGMVGVVPREFSRLVAHYPIFFRRTPADDAFEAGVMLGFFAKENLFLNGEHWDAHYVPLNVQRLPFAVMTRPEDASGNLNVAIDIDSPRIIKDGGEALFLGDGEPTEYLHKVTTALTELVQGTRMGADYSAALDRLGLIEKVRVDVEFADHSKVKLDGLYSISREKLNTVPSDKLLELRNAGYLELAHIQLASLIHINGLISRKNGKLAAQYRSPRA